MYVNWKISQIYLCFLLVLLQKSPVIPTHHNGSSGADAEAVRRDRQQQSEIHREPAEGGGHQERVGVAGDEARDHHHDEVLCD